MSPPKASECWSGQLAPPQISRPRSVCSILLRATHIYQSYTHILPASNFLNALTIGFLTQCLSALRLKHTSPPQYLTCGMTPGKAPHARTIAHAILPVSASHVFCSTSMNKFRQAMPLVVQRSCGAGQCCLKPSILCAYFGSWKDFTSRPPHNFCIALNCLVPELLLSILRLRCHPDWIPVFLRTWPSCPTIPGTTWRVRLFTCNG